MFRWAWLLPCPLHYPPDPHLGYAYSPEIHFNVFNYKIIDIEWYCISIEILRLITILAAKLYYVVVLSMNTIKFHGMKSSYSSSVVGDVIIVYNQYCMCSNL